MAFCKGAMSTIRKIWDNITPELEVIVEDVTVVTDKIKTLEKNPTVEAIVAAIPEGTKVEGWLNIAIDDVTGVADNVKTFAEKLKAWLDATAPTQSAQNAVAFKLASVASKVADIESGNSAQPESFYDSAVQLHVMVNQG